MTKGRSRPVPFELSEGELQAIHEATLEVLDRPGVRFTQEAALAVFRETGYEVDADMVRFRRRDVEEALRKAPPVILRRGIDRSCDVTLGDGSLSFAVGSIPLWVVDPDDYSRRDATYRDLLNFITLADALEHFAISNPVVQPPDIPVRVIHTVWDQTVVENTAKPGCTWYATDRQTALDSIRIFEAAAGGRKALRECCTWSVTICPDSALQWGKSIWGLLEMAKARIPISIVPMPLQGSTHPVTMAGALVQANAETLSAVVLAQLVEEGAPVIYAPSYGGIMDMSTASHAFGTPESALAAGCAARLGKWYGLPVDMMMGTCDSKAPDEQAAYEKMMTLLVPALAGADCITQAGSMLGFGLLASYEQLLIDDEICGQILHLVKKPAVDREHLAVDVIREVAAGGNYLMHDHTCRHFRREFYFPKLADRRSWQQWTADGRHDIVERAAARWPEILRAHKRRGIDETRRREVDRIVKDICDREKVEMTWLDGR